MIHLPEFTILPTDQPRKAPLCSRCGHRIVDGAAVVEWNKHEFWYCRGCAPYRPELPK